MDIEDLIDKAVAILERRGKISVSALKLGLSVDDEVIAVIRDELVDVLGVAEDRNGKVLIYVGESAEEDGASEQSRAAGEDLAERRVLTVMFCDLVGSTKLSTQLDSEDLRDVFARYQKLASDAIVSMDGYVAQYLGDGILAYFGYPRVHESDAARAVRTGLQVIDKLAGLNEALVAEFGVELQVRIGIHSGEVVIGDIGADTRKETLALGEVPNVAARLQGIASPNEIVVSGATHRLLGARVELASLGQQELAGLDRPVDAFRVTGLAELARLGDDDDTELIGREKELALLGEAWNAVDASRGSAIYLTGEAGIGKSTLLRGLLRHEAIDPANVIVVRGQDETRLSSFRPVINALRQAWDLGGNGGDAFERLAAAMSGRPPDDKAIVAELLGIAVPDSITLPPMTPQVQRHRTLTVLVKLLLRVPKGQKRLLVIEDLHWFDATSIELVDLLVEGIEPHATLLVLTARPEFEPGWDSRKVEKVAISRLSRTEMISLIKTVAHVRDLPDELARRITARAEGVPLFLEELTKTAFESDVVQTDADGYVSVEGELDDEVVPVSIYGCLMTRLDQTVVARQVAQLGAVIGNRFSYGLVLAASELDEKTLQKSMLDLIKTGIVRSVSSGANEVYEFTHAILRDVIGQSLLRATKRAMHGTIADTLLEKFAEQAASEPETVALHLTMAGRGTEALEHWRVAGLMALGRFAMAEAVDYFSRALEAAKEIAAADERSKVRLKLTVLKAAPLMAIRGWGSPDVRACYEEARELLDEIDDKTPQDLFPTLVGLASYYLVTANWAEARRLVNQNADLAERSGQPNLMVEAFSEKGVVEAYSLDPQDAEVSFSRAIELYDADSYAEHLLLFGRNGLVVNYSARALNHWATGYFASALEDCRQATVIARNPYHPFSVAWSMCSLPFITLLSREPEMGHDTIEEFCAFAEEQGFPYWLGQGLVCRGWHALLVGRLDDAREYIDQGLGIWYASGTRMFDAMMTTPLTRLQLATGDLDGALESVKKARSFIAKTGEIWFAPETEVLLGEVIEARNGGANEEALAAYHRAHNLAEGRGTRMMQLHAALHIARILGDRGENSAAIEILAPIEASLTEGYDIRARVDARKLLASLQ
jgi:class 3 adenylate cyclase/tetratricopeptide (TPR) repeat protein